jgi:hypothetical protein
MSERAPRHTKNLDIYGNRALPWSRPRDALAAVGSQHVTFFLGTAGRSGRPHSAGVGAAWHDGDIYIVSGPRTRKSRDLAINPACTLSVSLPGIDLTLDGEARRITDGPTLERIAALYRENGWPVKVEGDAFTAPYSAPSAGRPPWYLYRFVFHTAVGVAGEEPHGATRWRFDR